MHDLFAFAASKQPSLVSRGNPATAHCCVILKRYNVILPDCFLSGFVVSIHRTLHQIISIDMKQFVQETRSRVRNGNKVKVANHSPTGAPFFFTS